MNLHVKHVILDGPQGPHGVWVVQTEENWRTYYFNYAYENEADAQGVASAMLIGRSRNHDERASDLAANFVNAERVTGLWQSPRSKNWYLQRRPA